jgi:hypothetical protein
MLISPVLRIVGCSADAVPATDVAATALSKEIIESRLKLLLLTVNWVIRLASSFGFRR